jgi:monoamine oxidase
MNATPLAEGYLPRRVATTHVVILGAGFGGLELAARALARSYAGVLTEAT